MNRCPSDNIKGFITDLYKAELSIFFNHIFKVSLFVVRLLFLERLPYDKLRINVFLLKFLALMRLDNMIFEA